MTIKKALESKEVAIEIELQLTIKTVVDEFMTRFQKEEPMIHLLYASSEKLFKTRSMLKDRKWTERVTNFDIKVDEVNMQHSNDKFATKQGK